MVVDSDRPIIQPQLCRRPQEEQTMTNPDTLRFVEGELNYLVPMAERPRYFAYDAGPDAPTNMAHEAHTVRIHDMRPISH
jgi:hypothetical protein